MTLIDYKLIKVKQLSIITKRHEIYKAMKPYASIIKFTEIYNGSLICIIWIYPFKYFFSISPQKRSFDNKEISLFNVLIARYCMYEEKEKQTYFSEFIDFYFQFRSIKSSHHIFESKFDTRQTLQSFFLLHFYNIQKIILRTLFFVLFNSFSISFVCIKISSKIFSKMKISILLYLSIIFCFAFSSSFILIDITHILYIICLQIMFLITFLAKNFRKFLTFPFYYRIK